MDDQWLAECGMAAVHRLAGWDGLLLATATLLAAVYAWIAARLLRGGLHLLPASLLLAVAMLVGAPQFHVRPLVLTIGLLGVTFAWLVDVEAGVKPPRQLWWLVPLFVLWTNLHGGVLAGLGTVGLCVAGWCRCFGPLCRLRTMRPDSAGLTASVSSAVGDCSAGGVGRHDAAESLWSCPAAGLARNADHAAAEPDRGARPAEFDGADRLGHGGAGGRLCAVLIGV